MMSHSKQLNVTHQVHRDALEHQTRRHFLRDGSLGLAGVWFASNQAKAAAGSKHEIAHPATAKRVIYLHMAGSPTQLELFDYKPELRVLDGHDCPDEYLAGKRFAFITGIPKVLGHQHPFHQAGQSGQWMTNLMPHLEQVIDDVCVIRSMHTDQFNHAPAQLLLHTGSGNLGYPSMGSWIMYGLGTENQNLPGFIVLVSGGKKPSAGKSAWGSGFLPSVYQGVQCRSKGDPVLYLSNPKGITSDLRRRSIDALNRINRQTHETFGDPETLTRISQYEMAFRMQTSASEAFDLGGESAKSLEMYGAKPGAESFANNCLLARRLAERGVRYIQLFDWGWDHHGGSVSNSVTDGTPRKCRDIDKPVAALIADLKQRGLLEDTLIVWSGEFGRTPMRENRGGNQMKAIGRDHHKDAFTVWLAGGGIKGGTSFGETDPIGFSIARNPVHVRDLQATILHTLGINHEELTFPFQGLNQRLTSVPFPAHVVHDVLA